MFDGLDKQFMGYMVLESVGGEQKFALIEQVIFKGDGIPAYLVDRDGTVYNYAALMSTKLLDK